MIDKKTARKMKKKAKSNKFGWDKQDQKWLNAVQARRETVDARQLNFLTLVYDGDKSPGLGFVRLFRHSADYADIARIFGMPKGQLYNLAEKCGCKKMEAAIYADTTAPIKRLIEALEPWAVAMKLREGN